MDKWEGSQLNTAKEILAYELTKLVHGEEEAVRAVFKNSMAEMLFISGCNEQTEFAGLVPLPAAKSFN